MNPATENIIDLEAKRLELEYLRRLSNFLCRLEGDRIELHWLDLSVEVPTYTEMADALQIDLDHELVVEAFGYGALSELIEADDIVAKLGYRPAYRYVDPD